MSYKIYSLLNFNTSSYLANTQHFNDVTFSKVHGLSLTKLQALLGKSLVLYVIESSTVSVYMFSKYFYILFFLRFYLFIFRGKGREGEREGEKHQCAGETSICCLLHTPNQDLAENPGMCHAGELN